jgi:hypothetical protein
MAVFNKFHIFVQDLARKKHALNADALKVMLSNTSPVATNSVKGDIVEIGTGSGYNSGGNLASYVSDVDTAGVYKLVLSPVVFTASGGSIGPYRYAILWNSTSIGQNLIGWWDYGAALTLTSGNTFTVNLDQTNGVFTIS